MKHTILIIAICTTSLFTQEDIIHIKSTYYDGTPKQIIIYKYSNLYSNNPLELIDTLNYDKKGNLIYNFNEYFNNTWYCDRIGYIQIVNNKFKVLDSASCLGCYSYMDNWNIVNTDKQLYVNLNGSIFLDEDLNQEESKYNFKIEIQSIDNFIMKLGTFEYIFIKQ